MTTKLVCAATALVLAGLSACVSTPEAPEKVASWNNEPADRLIEVMGKPVDTSIAPNGTKTMTYQFEEKVPHVVPNHRGGAETVVNDYAECTVRFTVGANNRVASGGIDDSSERCSDLIPANPHQALAH